MAIGGLYGRRAYARKQLATQLVNDSMAVVTKKAHDELRLLPATGRDEIRTWFHGPCLNSAEFVRYICSNSFAEKLAACEPEQKEACLVNAFLRRVVSGNEILTRVEVIAEEVGSDLDRNWADCCGAISQKWDLHLKPRGSSSTSDLASRVEPLIRSEISAVIDLAHSAAERPALSEVTSEIGQSALMLLPITKLPHVRVPLFVFLAMGNFYKYFMAQRGNRKDAQRAISGRLALLGNRIGAEFESEFRNRIAALHTWQESALEEAATNYANQTIGIV